jgi:FlaA1/EpsC-like NDP-sugar epimerase
MSGPATPYTTEGLLRSVRASGYVILALSAVFPFMDLAMSLWPAHFESATWRFGAVGLFSNYAMGATIELFLLVVLALFANQRRVLLTLGAIAAIVTVILLGSSVMFTLDAVQTRARVTAVAIHRYDASAAEALAKILLFAIGNGLLARGAFAAARRDGRSSARARGTSPLVVAQMSEKS